MTESMTSLFNWQQQNKYSWRGTAGGNSYFVILTLDYKKFILQFPGIFSGNNSLVNREFDSLESAKEEAVRLYNL